MVQAGGLRPVTQGFSQLSINLINKLLYTRQCNNDMYKLGGLVICIGLNHDTFVWLMDDPILS